MDQMMGLLKVRVVRGKNSLSGTSAPATPTWFSLQKLKTRVVKKNINPEWNDDLTLSVVDPAQAIKLVVYDKDTFSVDDPMGNADFDLRPFLEAVQMRSAGATDEAVAKKVGPGRSNCLAEESSIYVAAGGELVQDVVLRLRDVESGEVQLRLQWVDLPRPSVF
ncbi:unnamed protein product [Spirodela intermedia]|uniref:C2 domain-containing protein n=1 Tax=Spirodela intermedia TaxID=51605 RepID=A0A7I8JUP7_SPIIN|nr:unnamed protein product [Spirodela intermedia]CAA6673182.1 unnamed protein product [Spirodela intermedia]